jgi:hypothetical protein
MKRNHDPQNKVPFIYDLTDDELDRFYHGAGKATIAVNVALDILACKYDDRAADDAAFLAALAQPGAKWLEGIMSCSQFCCFDEGRISQA